MGLAVRFSLTDLVMVPLLQYYLVCNICVIILLIMHCIALYCVNCCVNYFLLWIDLIIMRLYP